MDHNIFAKTIQKTNEWLGMVQEQLGWGEQQTYHAVKSVITALRDRLPAAEAVQLGAQLPTLLRGVYYEGYNPSWKPNKEIKTIQDFYEEVRLRSGKEIDAEQAVEGVMNVLKYKISIGELDDMITNLPKNLKMLLA